MFSGSVTRNLPLSALFLTIGFAVAVDGDFIIPLFSTTKVNVTPFTGSPLTAIATLPKTEVAPPPVE